jgi:hypothetical protein
MVIKGEGLYCLFKDDVDGRMKIIGVSKLESIIEL